MSQPTTYQSAAYAGQLTVYSYDELMMNYKPDANVTTPALTKFELAKIIGQRMEQLARDAPSMIDTSKVAMDGLVTHEKFRKIAELELKQRVLPFMIERTLPNGKKECWRLCDMVIPGF